VPIIKLRLPLAQTLEQRCFLLFLAMLALLIAMPFLASPAIAFQLLALKSGELRYFALTWGFGAAFYVFALTPLLYYVLRRDRLTPSCTTPLPHT
jgi:hypothetical protein